MAEKFIIVLDQGSSSSRALAFTPEGEIRFKAQRKLATAYPAPGLAEHDPEQVWATQRASLDEVLGKLPAGAELLGLGIAAQRSTLVLWDRVSGAALCPALSWQDGRAQEQLARVQLSNTAVHEITGLYKTPYYSASKLAWALEKVPAVKAAADEGRLLAAPVAAYILWRLSGGGIYALDPSQAQRTLLFNHKRLKWDARLLKAFGAPPAALPQVLPSSGLFGQVELAGQQVPVTAMLGDQQAAMLGLGLEAPGSGALNYGTGAFLLVNTGGKPVKIRGLLNSVGWQAAGGACYFTESTVNSAGTALEWLRLKFGLFGDISEVDGLCRASKNRVYCLPAIGGLGAPYWDFNAFTGFAGFSPQCDRSDLVRGMTEGIAYLVADAFDLVRRKGFGIAELKVSGGLSRIDWLLQFQADLTGARIAALDETEATAIGAGLAAARGLGLEPRWAAASAKRVFEPSVGEEERRGLLKAWRLFVRDSRRTGAALRRLGALPHR